MDNLPPSILKILADVYRGVQVYHYTGVSPYSYTNSAVGS